MLSIYAAYLAGVLWAGFAAFRWWRLGSATSATSGQDQVLQLAYPSLWSNGPIADSGGPDDETFDVLLLGASVLEQVAPEFAERAKSQDGAPWRIWNTAVSAHTSRDSHFKYDRLKDLSIDLVVWHDSINDVRMNCCPPGSFRTGYTHCAWYAALERRLEKGTVNLVDVVRSDVDRFIGLGEPEPEWIDEGAVLKTPDAYRANLEPILKDAATRGRRVVLVTMPLYLPPHYTREAFVEKRMDYGEGAYRLPIEVWGRPEHVVRGVDAHNAVLRELAAADPNVILIDLAREFPREGRYFCDPCHLTPQGITRWNDLVFAELKRAMASPSRAHR